MNRTTNAKRIDLILLLSLIGTDRFNIRSNKYAEPATHAGIIWISVLASIDIISLVTDTSYRVPNKFAVILIVNGVKIL